jgi:aminoglycoside 2'-N-acetyltransferase I
VTREAGGARLRTARTGELATADLGAIRRLMDDAFGSGEEAFGDDDWAHALGGVHVLLELDGRLLAHASVVPRELHVAGRPFRTGYVEAVATASDRQRTGLGSRVMRVVGDHILAVYELGALGTGSHAFYERLGWRTWRGPSSVRTADGERPTPDEDGYVMVLLTPVTAHLDLTLPISCDWRAGDVW